MANLDLGVYNLSLVNCNRIFVKYASDSIVNDLHKYGLLEKSLSNTTVRKIFYHHTILNFCDAILKNKTDKKSVLFFNNTQLEDCSLLQFFNEDDIIKYISAVINKMKLILPVKTYISRYSVPYFKHLLEKQQGRGHMLLNDIQQNTAKDFTKYSFSKAKQFAKRYELIWLNQEYFNYLSTKFLLIK
jgi:hypothetical protein